VATILSYAERGKQPIRKLTVSVKSTVVVSKRKEAERAFLIISTLVAVRVEAQYL